MEELKKIKKIPITDPNYLSLFNKIYKSYENIGIDTELERGYLMQNLYHFTSDYESALYEESQGFKSSTKYDCYESKEELVKTIKEGKRIMSLLITFYITFLDKTATIDEKYLINLLEGFYTEWSELNSGARYGCDCGCGGNSIDWDNLCNNNEENEIVYKLSLYYSLLETKK